MKIERGLAHLPPAIRPAVQFAYITRWRIPSEVLKLEWRHVDFEACVVRLDPHTTKNDEGRTFPFIDALERLFEAQKAEHERLKIDGVVCPWAGISTGCPGGTARTPSGRCSLALDSHPLIVYSSGRHACSPVGFKRSKIARQLLSARRHQRRAGWE